MKIEWSKVWARPSTRLGWWAVGFAAASFVLNFMWMFLPGGAGASFLCGIIAGVLALIALIREHERSWMVFVAVLFLLNVIVFVLAEIFMPH